MSRHLIDQPRIDHNSRLERFSRIARAEGQQDASRKLLAQARDRAGKRLAAFARIARGKTA